jgi:hypothetical protein
LSSSFDSVFHPVDGAILDLESLRTIAGADRTVLAATLKFLALDGIVIDGFELDGELAPSGPPGTRRPEARSAEAVVMPGTALVRAEDGRPFLVQTTEPRRVEWPTAAGPAVRGVLVLTVRPEGARGAGGLVPARQDLTCELGFVRPEQAALPHLLPIATPVGNGRDWITDVARVIQPEHPAIEVLLKQLDSLDQLIWDAQPEGSVWDRSVIGKNWVRYQTVAVTAVQSARLMLRTTPLTTRDRVRLLTALFEQLNSSVRVAANALLQFIGKPENAGPYAAVSQRLEEEAG